MGVIWVLMNGILGNETEMYTEVEIHKSDGRTVDTEK